VPRSVPKPQPLSRLARSATERFLTTMADAILGGPSYVPAMAGHPVTAPQAGLINETRRSEPGPKPKIAIACCTLPGIRRGRPSIAEAEALSGRILDASWDVLLQSGFEGFTFDRVARHAHIGKATIYSRFTGKIELMRALLQQRLEWRTNSIRQQGSDLPLEAAFRVRAGDTIKMLFSPDGILLERLIDWLDQESGEGQPIRVAAYRNAVVAIASAFAGQVMADGTAIGDAERAAHLWLEGLLGHAKVAFTQGASSPEEIDRWANYYTRFYFAGLKAIAHDD
jgi:AcrR family transcriptional regulator